MSNKPVLSNSKTAASRKYKGRKRVKAKETKGMGVSPFPNGKLFEIHGNELKPDPVGNLGQASVLSIPHVVLLFGVRKDAFDGLLAPIVQVPILRCIAGVVGQFLIILPDMPLYRFHTSLGVSTKMARPTVCTYLWIALVFPVSIPVSRAVG